MNIITHWYKFFNLVRCFTLILTLFSGTGQRFAVIQMTCGSQMLGRLFRDKEPSYQSPRTKRFESIQIKQKLVIKPHDLHYG